MITFILRPGSAQVFRLLQLPQTYQDIKTEALKKKFYDYIEI